MPKKHKYENKLQRLAKAASPAQKHARAKRRRKALLAQALAATPEERWRMHDEFLRSFGLYSHWQRKKLGFSL